MKDSVVKTVPLGDVVEVIGGGTPSKRNPAFYGGEIPWATVRDMNVEHLQETEHSITPAGLEGSSSKIIPAGEVVIATRVGLGKVCILGKDTAINQDLRGLVPKNDVEIDRRFLFHWYTSIADKVIEAGTGATVQGVKLPFVKSLPFPTLTLEEQQRIVVILDKAFEGLTRARAHAEANLRNARELFENFLAGKMASESNDWETYSFGDSNVLKIVDGDRGANYPKKTDFLSQGHCLFLNTKNVRPDGFNFDETMFISEERDQLLRKGKLLPGDVLLTTRGTIGNVAIFDDTVPYEHIRINSGMLILRPNEDIVRGEFLFELLRSGVIKEQIEEHVSGAAQPQLPIRSLVKFRLPAPKSTDEQLEIVERLKQLGVKVSEMVEGYETKLQDIDDLRLSLLQKAFAGELTRAEAA